MNADELTLLGEKVRQAAQKINALKEERTRLLNLMERQKEDLNFFQRENRQAEKMVTQNQRLEKEREKIREKVQILVDRLEKAGI